LVLIFIFSIGIDIRALSAERVFHACIVATLVTVPFAARIHTAFAASPPALH
jgi:hypothetical protein